MIKVIDSHNLVIQKGPKAKPIVVHRDKLKLCRSPAIKTNDDTSTDTYPSFVETNDDECVSPVDPDATNPDENDVTSVRPRRNNRKQPAYLRDYTCCCVFSGTDMASRQIQIPSGKPYCFICNTAFQSMYNLNRHNASHREKHAEIQAEAGVLQATRADDTSRQARSVLADGSITSRSHQVNAVYTSPPEMNKPDVPTVRSDIERISSLVATTLEDRTSRTISEMIQLLVSQRVDLASAQLVVEATLATAKYVAGLHAAHEQLRTATRSASRDELLHQIGDQFTRFLVGLPRANATLREDTATQVDPNVSAEVPPPVGSAIDDAASVETTDNLITEVTRTEEMTMENAVNLPLNERLPIARRYFQIDLCDSQVIDQEITASKSMEGVNRVVANETPMLARDELTATDPIETPVVPVSEKSNEYRNRGFVVKHGKRPAQLNLRQKPEEDGASTLMSSGKRRMSSTLEGAGQAKAKGQQHEGTLPVEAPTIYTKATLPPSTSQEERNLLASLTQNSNKLNHQCSRAANHRQ